MLTITGNIIRFLCFALLVVFIGLEASNHAARDHKRTVLIASAIIAGVCAAILLAQAIMFVRTLYIIRKQKKCW